MATTPVKKDEAKPSVWDKLDVKIQYVGRSITLPAEPENMPPEKAIEALQRRVADDNQKFNVYEVIDTYPHDGAVAFYKAMVELYGWASPQTVQTFFGPRHPQMLSIQVGPGIGDVMQCPIGQFMLPGVSEPVNAGFNVDERGRPIFLINGEVKKKDRHILIELAVKTREIVKRESIYRGKPIRLGVDSDGDLDMNRPPEFLDVSDMTMSNLMFNDDIQQQIDTNILVPIRETEMCRKYKIPLKRGILLEGPFGTGKSLTARLAARVAEENGWTFVLLDNVSGLKTALEFANRYSPAVVFAEDIDRIASERDDDANDLVNMIDGVVSKGSEIITVLTTNFVEKLDRVILRPGRLDAVISIRAPEPETVKRLIRYYARELLDATEDLTLSSRELAGQIPASIREAVERAKLGMIGRKDRHLLDSDLVTAAQTMKNHLALLNSDKKEESSSDRLAKSLREVISGIDTSLPHEISVAQNLAKEARNHARAANGNATEAKKNAASAAEDAHEIRERLGF